MDNFDRGLLKWMPFDALTGFKGAITALKQKRLKKDKPLLSDDQFDLLNYHASIAITYEQSITLYYYRDGFIYTVSGRIEKIIRHENRLKLAGKWYKLSDVLDIILLENCIKYEDML